jgi:hypothetical protein
MFDGVSCWLKQHLPSITTIRRRRKEVVNLCSYTISKKKGSGKILWRVANLYKQTINAWNNPFHLPRKTIHVNTVYRLQQDPSCNKILKHIILFSKYMKPYVVFKLYSHKTSFSKFINSNTAWFSYLYEYSDFVITYNTNATVRSYV